MAFEHLLSPLQVGSVTLRNRVVSTAHGALLGFYPDNDDGERYIAYQEARAKGGCGLIILLPIQVHRTSQVNGMRPPTPSVFIPKLRRMADAVHRHEAKVFVQLMHAGCQLNSRENEDFLPLWAFSDGLMAPTGAEMAHQMEPEEIEEVIEGYVSYAKAAREGGLDGVEIHGAHGYLIHESWTPWGNRRTDEWADPLRFVRTILRRVRDAVGRDFVVGIRVSGDDLRAEGRDMADMQQIARQLEATGTLDYVNVSIGSRGAHYAIAVGSMHVPHGAYVTLAAGIKRMIGLPVIAAGRINHPQLAEEVIATGKADLVAMTRAQIADPDLVRKTIAGRVDDIRPCIGCNQGCIERVSDRLPLTCTMNPSAGKERQLGELRPAVVRKRVVVAGGGPAGLKAAEIAARRGHAVTLVEQASRLGGQVLLATRVENRAEFGEAVRYLEDQIAKLGVECLLGTAATPDLVLGLTPDAVIIATGSTPIRPSLHGTGRMDFFTIEDVLTDRVTCDGHVLLYDMIGTQASVSTAEYLANGKRRVAYVTPFLHAGANLGFTHIRFAHEHLLKAGVELIPSAAITRLEDRDVILSNVYSKRETRIAAVDAVVISAGNKARPELFRALKDRVAQVLIAGDAVAPRNALTAIHEGDRAGRAI